MRALVLAGHGSHISPNTAGLVWNYVDQLRGWGVADEVTACFWKEAPAFGQVIDTLVSDEVTVVPVFTATGYFSTQVIPAEMGLEGEVTRRDGRTITYTKALGEHPALTDVVRQRVTDALQDAQLDPAQVAVAVIGHGTGRNADSRITTRQQAEHLRHDDLVAEVVAVFLDDSPSIPDLYDMTNAPNVVAVPFFLAPGSHVSIDVPEALGIGATLHDPVAVRGRTVYYTPPVGTDETICNLVVALMRDAGQVVARQPSAGAWGYLPQVGGDALWAAVTDAGALTFGQLQLTPNRVAPLGDGDAGERVDTPARLRQIVREAPFRPLATTLDLPGGWYVEVETSQTLHAVVETVYPGAVADWSRNQRGVFVPDTLRQVSERQVGMFKGVHAGPQEHITAVVGAVCGRCCRHPTWHHGVTPISEIPCKAPCNILMSQLKES